MRIETIVLASQNKGKVREIQQVLADLPITILSLGEVAPDLELEEPYQTYRENARAKAEAVAARVNGWALADDSGLEVDALNGEPGVYSARYGGEDLSMTDRCHLILKKLKGVPHEERTARFRALLVLTHPDHNEAVFEGVWEGFIAEDLKGGKGFGYDPIFMDKGTLRRAAEMEGGEKNRLSHRGQAVSQLVEFLKKSQ